MNTVNQSKPLIIIIFQRYGWWCWWWFIFIFCVLIIIGPTSGLWSMTPPNTHPINGFVQHHSVGRRPSLISMSPAAGPRIEPYLLILSMHRTPSWINLGQQQSSSSSSSNSDINDISAKSASSNNSNNSKQQTSGYRESQTTQIKSNKKRRRSSSTMVASKVDAAVDGRQSALFALKFSGKQQQEEETEMSAEEEGSLEEDPKSSLNNNNDEVVFNFQTKKGPKISRTVRHRHKNMEKDFEIIGTLTGVAGGKIALPCNISTSTPKDSVTLILWYKDESTTPIYSVDARKGVSLEAARRVTDENLASRAYMNTGTSPYAHLMLELLTPEDAGEYACRVDFRKERTRNSVIFLKIIVPPEKPQIVDSTGESLPSLIGPYNEGDRLELVCEVEGGKPTPSLTWWRESVLLDDTYEQLTTPNGNTLVRNQLVIPALSRQDLMAVFTCQASNNNISLPSTATVTVDLNFRPLTVKILGERRQSLSAGKVSIIVCESTGSRPPATITWWLGGDGTKLRNAQEQISADGNKTTSRLSLTVTIDDLGKELTCRAENPHVQSSSIEDSIQLDINYAPQVTLKLGSNLRHSHIQEGNDVYFECLIRASPSSYDVRWHFEGRELQTNTSAGIIVSNQSLVLQKVKRQQRGKYTCSATNSEGEGESNAVHLRVQYAPFCKTGQKIIYGAARHETVNILCELEADPAEVEFFWSYNGTGQEPRRETATLKYESNGALSSIGHYTPHTEFDYGTIYCWGRNAVGVQSKPCAFSIVAAGSPDPVRNCSVFNITEDSMRVECQEGYDGGLQQSFLLEIYDTTERNSALRANITSPVPQFQLNQLQPAHTYLFVIYAINAKGRSKGIALTAFTLAMPESMNRLAKGNVWQLNFNPSLVVLIAVVTGLVLIAFFIVLIVRWRTMKPSNHQRAPCIQANAANVHNRFDCPDNKLNNNHSNVGDDNLLDKEKSSSNESNGGQNNNNGSSSQTTTNSTILSSDMSSSINTTGLFRKSGSGVAVHEETFSEMAGDPLTGKNATDLDDLMLAQNDQTTDHKLTIPLNGGQTTGTLTSSGQMGQAQIIRSNIYSSIPPPPPLSQNGATTPLANNNKHVSWRPATPPSPTPNIYTQYQHIGYMPLPTIATGNDTFHMIATHHPLNANLVPYPLASNNNYETAFLDGQPKLVTNDGGYLIDTNNHTVPAHSLPPYDVLMSSTNIPHPHQHQNPYAAAAACGGNLQQQQMPPTYGTIPRRVRVIPGMMGVSGVASSMASSSSGGSIGTSAASSFHPHQHQQHSIPTGTATPTNVSTSNSNNNTLVAANDTSSLRSSPMTDV